jgi:hypothetical protein
MVRYELIIMLSPLVVGGGEVLVVVVSVVVEVERVLVDRGGHLRARVHVRDVARGGVAVGGVGGDGEGADGDAASCWMLLSAESYSC